MFPKIRKYIFPVLVIGLTSCSEPQSSHATKVMDLGSFTIQAPISWTEIKLHGIDSYAGAIAIDDKDTLQFDLGHFANTLTEYDVTVIERSHLKHVRYLADTSEWVIVNDRMSVDLDRYRKNNVLWDTIDGRKVKIVYPRRPGIGIVGVYIDSLLISRSGVERFNL